MTAVRCTAPRQGHQPGSAAERACPVHGRQASRRASVAVAAPVPSDDPTLVTRYDDGAVMSKEWRVGGERHRTDRPAVVWYRPDGTVESEEWYVGGQLHRIDGPAIVRYRSDGTIESEEWYVGGQLHRIDGPAVVRYHSDGTVMSEEWRVGGKRHRTDGPARVWYHPDGTIGVEEWVVGGQFHRTDGPAYVQYHSDGTVESEAWCVDNTEVEPWEALGRHLMIRGVSELSAEALKQIAKDVPWQHWSELGPDHPIVALWATVHPRADISAD